MKIILVGASGTIGKAVDAELSARHEIVRVGRSSGDVRVDMADPASVARLYAQTGPFDALVSTAGNVHFGPLEQFTPELFEVGLRDKLMGQVNLVMQGLEHIRDGGSFTLTSGLLNEDPIRQGLSAAMANGGLEGFVRGAAIELPRGLRINIVSPTVLEESLPAYGPFFRGTKAVPASEVALGYAKSVEGAQTGRVYRIGWSRDA
ncbi:NAD(P)-dependent dehydrogenase, short-chain alcohol dehydrogenase family [Tistlia consotensis]|uniref:NAD(P)-dependent dehydrogenase, short-chain alcohol dehydrogenase family n=1 Tax=Tistlia consotensis USBA 355 TaxID=560819 RepID=A0A1Y6CIS5_9PROT|nr:short chain dehydrogenase [Tistlia consotensis]SMF68662.1 NAD(P)-dependent dehydrogenase, short-chain alcohol dehydrogenase family [Tistlia consotensis USBA 355]SNS01170.1 NAD(P)-dependent dehydrogenase, short-chain alcohol dehydrogenase family [Tistlia consotensis]